MNRLWIGWIMGVCLLLPSAASANGSVQEGNKTGNFNDNRQQRMMDRNWHEKMKQKEQKLLGLVKEYTPEKQKEWVSVINDRNSIREKWLSPEFANKRAQLKKEQMSKIDTLQKQYEEGNISKDELTKKIKGAKSMGNSQTYNELKDAVKNKNNKKAASILNQLLIKYKQQNQMMKAAMNAL